jgi:hypothetical protein
VGGGVPRIQISGYATVEQEEENMTHRFPLVRFAAVIMIVAMPFAAFAASPVGEARGGGSSIDFASTLTGHQSVRLVMVDPNGDVVVDKTFPNGRALQVRVSDLGTAPVDGAYRYELTVTPAINAGLAKKLEAARAANDEAAARKIMRDNGLETIAQSGTFTLSNGSFLDPQAQEAGANLDGGVASLRDNGVGGNVPRTNPANAGTSGGGKVTVNDQVIPDDLIVQGSGCFGFDCVNNESFGFDTIRMKENNTRIKFEDTSVGTFPTNDWQLTANDSASGGASKFSIEDITGVKVPFTVTGGAATNSIFVDSTGRVGFRTSTPVLDLHVATSNTPALRLEQNNSGGFTAQTWDVAGNEANFFVRDVTGGSRLPFRIRPGAPTSSIDISADGDVGIGTASPDVALHVLSDTTGAAVERLRNTSATGFSGTEYLDETGNVDLFFGIHNPTSTTRLNSLNSNNIVMMVNSSERLRVSTTAVTVTGDFSVTGVKNFAMVDPADSTKAIYYAALEGPEAGTYFRGTAKTVNGEVTIELPGVFSRITESERMTVQLTAVGAPAQLYVASRSPEKLVIKLADGATDVEFDYLVQGVRKGYLDYQVERANTIGVQK